MEYFQLIEIVLTLLTYVFDVIAGVKGAGNLRERREAKKAGETPPEITGWAAMFLIGLAVAVAMTLYIILRRVL